MNARRLAFVLGLLLVGNTAGFGFQQPLIEPGHQSDVEKTLKVLNDERAGGHLYKNEGEATAPRAAIHVLKRAGKIRRSKLPPGWWGEPPPIFLTADVSNKGGFAPERLWGNDVDWEPAIAVDRTSSYVYQMTSRYGVPQCKSGCADPAIIFRRSSNGGKTWEPDQYVLTSEGAQNDPEIEVAGDGVLYAALMDDFIPGVVFIKSQNRGETWSEPIPMSSPGTRISWSDKPMLAVSRDGKDVYLAFNASHSFVAASHDRGETWAAAVKTNHDLRYWFHSGAAVSPNGDVYFASSDYAVDFRGEVGLDVIRSTDGGMTWSTDRVDTSAQLPDCQWSPGCYFGFFGPQAAVAVDSVGTVMVAYNASDLDGAPQSLYVRVSGNGVDWGDRVLISPPSGNVLAGFPALASGAEPGDFRVAWVDDRNGSQEAFNVWYRQTRDGGLTWSEAVRLSAATDGAPYKTVDGFTFPYGDYLEIDVDGEGATHAIWGEGSSFGGKGGTWYTRSR